VKIESYDYLPSDYLEKILDIADTDSVPVLQPEDPIPLSGASESLVNFFQSDEDKDENQQCNVYFVFYTWS